MPRKGKTRVVEEVGGVKNLTSNPSPKSRLGDIGYVDETGNWRCVVNILDEASCEPLEINCLRLARGRPQYITESKFVPFDEPVVKLYGGGGCQILTGDDLASLMGSEDLAKKARRFSLGVMISPRPQQTMAAFIMGPKIFVRELHLPVIVLQAWLRAYSPQIGKFARKLFQLCPPSTERPQLCLCLKEFFTETWRMIDIKSRHDASPVAVGWKAGSLNDRSGSWTLLEMAHPTSVVSGGVSNYNDGTEWAIGSDGPVVQVPPKWSFYWFMRCFIRNPEEIVESMQPIQLPSSRTKEVDTADNCA